MHAFYALGFILEVLSVANQNKISISKIDCNVEIERKNGMFQHGFIFSIFRISP